MNPDWHLQARCRGLDTNLFFGERGGSDGTYQQAMELCNGVPDARANANHNIKFLVIGPPCPVRNECLAFAMKAEDASYRYGIFGGLSPNDRDTLGRFDQEDWPRVERELRAGRIVVGSRQDIRRRRAERSRIERETAVSVMRSRVERENRSRVERDHATGEPLSSRRRRDDGDPPRWTVPAGFSSGLTELFALLRDARVQDDDEQRVRDGRSAAVFRFET